MAPKRCLRTLSHRLDPLISGKKQRGTEQILLFISDGLTGMVNAIQEIYPQAKYQTCCVHLARNIAHKVRVSDRSEICEDFKSVYRAGMKKQVEPP